MTRTKTIFMILVFLLLAYTGLGGKSSKIKEEQMCPKKPIKKEQCCNEVMPMEGEVLRHIFETVLRLGRTPTIKEIASSLKRSDKDVIHTLDELESKDLLLRKKGTQEIISIYPFSSVPTEHQLFLEDGKKLFAMCAVDALGMPLMFNRDIKIVSQCEECKQEITINIKNEEIVSMSHPGIMIWSPKNQKSGPSAETCCPKVNFFCSKEHLEEWEARNNDLAKIGHSVPLEQDFPRITECWKRYGETLGIR